MTEENVFERLLGELQTAHDSLKALFLQNKPFAPKQMLDLLKNYSLFIRAIELQLLKTEEGQKALKRFYKVQREKVKTTYNNRKVSKTTKNGVKHL